MSTAYQFQLNFDPKCGTKKLISNDAKRRIIDAIADINPKPRSCNFDSIFVGYDGEAQVYKRRDGYFYLSFRLVAESQFEASQLAMGVCEQVAKLALPQFEFTMTAVTFG